MNYKQFSNIFLLELASEYREGTLPFHALVDIDLWRQIFPDRHASVDQVQWYNIKLNAYSLNDKENSLLLIYSLPERMEKKEAKFIGLRINNMSHDLSYYILRRPKYEDESWELYQYNFTERKEIYIDSMPTTNSLREFKYMIERIPNGEPHQESLFSLIKNSIRKTDVLSLAFN